MSDFLPEQTPEENRQDTAKFKAVLIVCAVTAFAVAPFITEPFTGFAPEQLPNPIEQPPIQPAGYAFSIWGVIYLWLVAHAGFGMVKRDTAADWDIGRWPLFISIALGASWIAVALVAPVVATVMIWLMLAGALGALVRAPARDMGWNALPLGLYAGWLTAASCVALATVVMGYNMLPPLAASFAALLMALVIAVLVTRRVAIATYPLAVGWALAGVVAANLGSAPSLAIAAGLGVAIMAWLTWKSYQARA